MKAIKDTSRVLGDLTQLYVEEMMKRKKKKCVSLIDCPVCGNSKENLKVFNTDVSALVVCDVCDLTMRLNKTKCVENPNCYTMIREV